MGDGLQDICRREELHDFSKKIKNQLDSLSILD